MKTCPLCDTPYPDQHASCPTDGAILIESQELAPGHTVRGKYRIAQKLGRGGMGVVYLAEHKLLGGHVALKFLAPELCRDPQFVKRFRNEAKAAYLLYHPNIVQVTDLDQDESGSLFIAMEYVRGPNLRTILREANGPLPVARALAIAAGVAAGLSAAHSRGVVHRDIKPDNILLAPRQDGGETAKVLDFGIAVISETMTHLSRTHGVLLTPQYAAPEQWRGVPAAELDGRTDLYALGGVLYEMLTGRTPFRAENMEGWMYEHLQGVPADIDQLRPDLAAQSPGLSAIVMRLLAREREQRWPSAETLVEALAIKPPESRRIGSGLPPDAMAPVPRPAAKPAVESASTRDPANVAPPTVVELPTPARHSRVWLWAAAGLLLAALGVWLGVRFLRPAPVTPLPALIPGEGTYPRSQTIAISDSIPNASIYYTLDGSPPTQASHVYTQPLLLASLPSGGWIRAIAIAPGHQPSSDVSGRYFATPDPYQEGKDSYDRQDYAKARVQFAEACEGGNLNGCNYLGYLYANGLGGTKSESMAQSIYQSACDRGHLKSCTSLGSLLQDAGNADQARKYYKKACDGGQADGCSLLNRLQ